MNNRSSHIIGMLRRLDVLLEPAVAALKTSSEPGPASPLRGLYITPEEAAGLLARDPGAPSLNPARTQPQPLLGSMAEIPEFSELAQTCDLSPFDLDITVVALAPDLDLRYERIYAYLQDDVTRRRPSVDLALNLLTSTAEEKLARHANFSLEAPLIRHGLLRLVPDPHHVEPPLLGNYLKLDDQVVRLLTGEQGMDRRLDGYCQLQVPDPKLMRDFYPPLEARTFDSLRNLIGRPRAATWALKFYFSGRRGSGKLTTAQALASEAGLPLLVCYLGRWPEGKNEFESTLRSTFREAWLKKAVLYLDDVDVLRRDGQSMRFSHVLAAVAAHSGIAILAGTEAWAAPARAPSDIIAVNFEAPSFDLRRTHWQASLATRGVVLDVTELDILAGRFRLTTGQIHNTVEMARMYSLWRTAGHESPMASTTSQASGVTLGDLFATVRRQCGHELAKLARKIEAKQSWSDLVLPPDQLSQLREICEQARHRQLVYGEWGFDRKLSLGKGLNALFAGPPGTGKTMAAEVISRELNLDVYKIDLSQVVSKYIGETEKNLDRIFTAAESANAILLFDEADALFGKRSEVKDSHDRYANVEVGYLLQKMEEYEGVAILATNLRKNLDEAFARRMQFVVDFPFPDEEHRLRIWEVTFPRQAPLGPDIDYSALAREVKLAGGNIKNIALAAAFYAAADGHIIHQVHLARAARREHQKLGRTWNESSLQTASERVQ